MKKQGFIFFILCLVFGSLSAQDSQKVLDELSKKARGYKSIYAEYDSQLIDKQAGIDVKQSGTIKVQGESYNIDLEDYTVISDGTSLWTYEKSSNTCYIDDVEEADNAGFSPTEMFTIWENDFKHEMKGTEDVGVVSCYHINLYPLNPAEEDYHTIQLFIDISKMEVLKIVVKGRQGNDMIYSVKSFEPNATMGAQDFNFDPNQYEGLEIIDQRI